MNKTQRIDWMDVGKGIGILLVVFGHIFRENMLNEYPACNVLYLWVYTFHMPFMMALSGFMFMHEFEKYEKRGVLSFARSKINRLIKPYVVYGALVYIIISICFKISPLASVLSSAGYVPMNVPEFIKGMIIADNQYSFHLWYIYDLAVISVAVLVFLLLVKKIGIWKWKNAALIVLALSVMTYSLCTIGTTSTRIFSVIRQMLPWFILGCLIEEWKINAKFAWYAGVPAVLLLILKPEYLNVADGALCRIVQHALTALTIFMLIELAKAIEKVSFLKYLGRKSMVIYLFHQPFIGAGASIICYNVLKLPLLLTLVITFTASIFIPLLAEAILNKLKIKNLIF